MDTLWFFLVKFSSGKCYMICNNDAHLPPHQAKRTQTEPYQLLQRHRLPVNHVISDFEWLRRTVISSRFNRDLVLKKTNTVIVESFKSKYKSIQVRWGQFLGLCLFCLFLGINFWMRRVFSWETKSFVNSFRRRCNFVCEGYPQMHVPQKLSHQDF